uniref:Family with sequence similarity 71 member F1 n=1 Tax=Pelusios castaneus TaxID=367368 RepID=A0A8C8RFA7_9SAUR
MAGLSCSAGDSGWGRLHAVDPAQGVHLGLEGGLLCQLLRSPAYNLFPKSAVFESNFVQVTKQGKWVDIHNTPTLVTLGVTSSEPCLPLPNIGELEKLTGSHVIPAHGGQGRTGPLILSFAARLLPLRHVRLSVQDSSRRLLRVQVVTGKVYYLRLHQEHPEVVFALWSRLAGILERGLSITTKDPSIHVPHSLVLSVGSSSTSSPGEVRPPKAGDGHPRHRSFNQPVGERASHTGGTRALAQIRTNVISLFRDSSPSGIVRCGANLLPGQRNRGIQAAQEVNAFPRASLQPFSPGAGQVTQGQSLNTGSQVAYHGVSRTARYCSKAQLPQLPLKWSDTQAAALRCV